jgi:hypothetical protein
MEGSITISLRNFVGEGIITLCSERNHHSPKARREKIWRVRLCKNSTILRQNIEAIYDYFALAPINQLDEVVSQSMIQ